MHFVREAMPALIAVLVLAITPAQAGAQSATELIEQAGQHDATQSLGPGVDRQKALELYEKALAAGPDQQQRLQVLFRMAQLHGCIFDRKKGETPDLRKAINLYQEIVESYPPQEPMVMTAIGLISDHYMSLREFDAALTWARRAVEYDTSEAQKNINDIRRKEDSLANTQYAPDERREIIERAIRSASLVEDLQAMKAGRVAAVDRVARAAELMDPLRAHGELKAIADKYAGTPVGDRASRKFQEAMDRWASLWAPNFELPQDPEAAWQPASDAAIISNRNDTGAEVRPGPSIEIITGPGAPEPNTTTKPKTAVPLTESPRAPPIILLSACTVVAAGLIALGLAALRTRRKTLSRSAEHDT